MYLIKELTNVNESGTQRIENEGRETQEGECQVILIESRPIFKIVEVESAVVLSRMARAVGVLANLPEGQKCAQNMSERLKNS